ncbi:MAG: ABC transporter permease [Bacteroidales bacterium]
MNLIIAFIRKEFLQIRRNPIMIMIILVMPVIQLLLLVYAANPVMKEVRIGVIDPDLSQTSRQMVNQVIASGYFKLSGHFETREQAIREIESRHLDLILQFPPNMERSLLKELSPSILLSVDAVNGMKAGLAASYVSQIIQNYAREKALKIQVSALGKEHTSGGANLSLTYSQWFNPLMDHKSFILPGILSTLLTIISIVLSATNIVREKEMGNIEQINVTPITKLQFMVGKLIPYGIIGLIQFSIGLLVMRFYFDLPISGSLSLLYLVACIYILLVLGIGFLISIISDTQAQAMFTTLFFLFIFILMSGFVTPVASMPAWAQHMNVVNPVAYMVYLMQSIILKGSTMADLYPQIGVLTLLAVLLNSLAVLFYRKSSE